ncbi:tRNA (adenosine(37)-N6)-threonylcarbamoyltransferase complex dimerization subunit type 1 TsaB, partial [bacterium]|nr:tRNA (adenosine(37)-N6)-threonylcarbamoyltransferase complex dimerization subunit type 1 TsaB [bacterium]
MILAIDTTGFKCGTALWDNGRITLLETEEKLRHNEVIFAQIQQLLQDQNSSLADVEAVAVSSGPGSFTGLRVGMAVAKSLCWSLEIPFIAVPTLEGLANCAPADIYSVISIMPARADEVYWSHFAYENNRWEDQTLER